jgi:hypothetical protein
MRFFILLPLWVIGTWLSAQDAPPGALPGKCYAKCFINNQYEMITERVMVQAPALRNKEVPPQFAEKRLYLPVKPAFQTYQVEAERMSFKDTLIETRPASVGIRIEPPLLSPSAAGTPPRLFDTVYTIVPAEWEDYTRYVQVTPAQPRYVAEAATFSADTLWYPRVAAHTRFDIREPEIRITSDRIQTRAPMTRWVITTADPMCLGANPDHCLVGCMVEIPAEYQSIVRKINQGCKGSGIPDEGCVEKKVVGAEMAAVPGWKCRKEGGVRREIIPATYQALRAYRLKREARVERQLVPVTDPALQRTYVQTPALVVYENIPPVFQRLRISVVVDTMHWEVTKVPATYQAVTVKTLAADASLVTQNMPPEYVTVNKRILLRPGGFTEWREVLCGEKVTGYTVRQIQEALRSKGYAPGPIDSKFGVRTKKALIQFQEDHDLPVGSLDVDTLSRLLGGGDAVSGH